VTVVGRRPPEISNRPEQRANVATVGVANTNPLKHSTSALLGVYPPENLAWWPSLWVDQKGSAGIVVFETRSPETGKRQTHTTRKLYSFRTLSGARKQRQLRVP
jgi:hypothetical protein